MRKLGLDLGERRIGVAVSDPTGTLASPLQTVQRRRGKRPPITTLERIAREQDVRAIVVGLPLTLEGEEDPWCAEVRRIGDALAARLEMPVSYIDERMSSVQAEQAIRQSGGTRKSREDKGRVDAAAAAVILQRHLDTVGSE
ncbi:MAG: Holliday junction resolvase RuvX [Gemmatimonadetes bacterium]|nr:Holliday junction resolvase RuvX [Gemmatimonadota bacterium]MBT8402960.1 Holliday junction resolvase RuvX [Gemmatimonadota bacterium]NNF39162.1 Holliday junction resolvase RuvX [Gemmatimonadota bacterium]NNK62854.1 Holliday junction resolvase RuvX [Gemmatimonadota bacterium]